MTKDFDLPYQIIDGSLFHIDSGGQRHRICGPAGQLAVAYDSEDGVLHKHGEYHAVKSWYETTRAVLMKQSSTADLAMGLTLVSLRADENWVREVNRCVSVAGAVMGIEERALTIGTPAPSPSP